MHAAGLRANFASGRRARYAQRRAYTSSPAIEVAVLRLLSVCVFLLVTQLAHAERLSNEQDIRERSEEYGSLAFSPDGEKLYAAGDGAVIKVRDTATGELLSQIDEQERCYTWALAVSPDGKTLAASHGYSGTEEGVVRLFDAESGALAKVLRGHQRVVRSIAFSIENKTVVTCGDDHTLRWWDAATGVELASRSTAGVMFACDPQSGVIAVPAKGAGVEIWDLTTRTQERSIGDESTVYQLAIPPGGRLLATAGESDHDQTIRVWDVSTGESLASFGAKHNDIPARLAFSPDGKLLASATLNGRVTLWDARTGTHQDWARGGCTSGLRFSPDGKQLAQAYGVSDSSSGVRLWEVAED